MAKKTRKRVDKSALDGAVEVLDDLPPGEPNGEGSSATSGGRAVDETSSAAENEGAIGRGKEGVESVGDGVLPGASEPVLVDSARADVVSSPDSTAGGKEASAEGSQATKPSRRSRSSMSWVMR